MGRDRRYLGTIADGRVQKLRGPVVLIAVWAIKPDEILARSNDSQDNPSECLIGACARVFDNAAERGGISRIIVPAVRYLNRDRFCRTETNGPL